MNIIQKITMVMTALLFFLPTAIVSGGEISRELQSVLDTAAKKDKISVIVELNEQVDRKQFKKFKKETASAEAVERTQGLGCRESGIPEVLSARQ